MFLWNSQRGLFRRSPVQRRGSRQGPGRSPRARPLVLEVLEGRTLPSTFTVLNLADSGPGSLRQAVVDANANPGLDVINFAPGLSGTVTLTSGQLSITDHLTIDGPSAAQLAVGGNDASRVFAIESGIVVSMDDLTITHGRADNGGGIWNAGGILTLSRVVVSDNQALGAPGATANGGGIFNEGGTLIVSQSTFTCNVVVGGRRLDVNSPGRGGGIANDVGATLTVSDSTFSDNQAIGGVGEPGVAGSAGAGGGIWSGADSGL